MDIYIIDYLNDCDNIEKYITLIKEYISQKNNLL